MKTFLSPLQQTLLIRIPPEGLSMPFFFCICLCVSCVAFFQGSTPPPPHAISNPHFLWDLRLSHSISSSGSYSPLAGAPAGISPSLASGHSITAPTTTTMPYPPAVPAGRTVCACASTLQPLLWSGWLQWVVGLWQRLGRFCICLSL